MGTTGVDSGFLPAGTVIEVRNRYTLGWSTGFVIEGSTPEGYRVRRLSDGAVLPMAFSPHDVRPPGRDPFNGIAVLPAS